MWFLALLSTYLITEYLLYRIKKSDIIIEKKIQAASIVSWIGGGLSILAITIL